MNFFKRHQFFIAGVCAALALAFYALLPNQLFKVPYSTTVYARHGELIGARVAADGQWRFPVANRLPKGYVDAVLLFEDRYFFQHPGINPFALVRAVRANAKAGKVVQGGSTLTMQVVRMALQNQPRTYEQKLREMLLALRLELSYTKKEILLLYSAHAPFGGNVVGLEAASWRYFGHSPEGLSAAEYALLAVLPNAPAVLRPGKNGEVLLQKRNRLLLQLRQNNRITKEELALALLEPLPAKPLLLPDVSPHLTQFATTLATGKVHKTTLDVALQNRLADILARHHRRWVANGVHNGAILVADAKTGAVLVYLGNTMAGQQHGQFVDVIRAPRSSGSILKPFLYSAMQRNGQLLPNQLMVDIPTFLSGFNPENYNRDYEGAVPAADALARSLNVPFVRALKSFGVPLFKHELQSLGFSTINRPANQYGLSLIVGGAEVTLWEVAAAYQAHAQVVLGANVKSPGWALHFSREDTLRKNPVIDAGAAWLTLQAMKKHTDAFDGDALVNNYANRVAWKTGTSFGYRDAWSVGVTPNYIVAVWMGNADGEGRPGIVGVQAAAPLMFEVFSALGDRAEAFIAPYNHLVKATCCRQSGMLAGEFCDEKLETWVATGAENAGLCTYHQPVLVIDGGRQRVTANCQTADAQHVNWFVLSPASAFYFKQKHAAYRPLPPLAAHCGGSAQRPLQLIYPSNFQKVVHTRQASGQSGVVVFKLAHLNPEKVVFWHADEVFLGQTQYRHELPVQLPKGKYRLLVIDEDGNELTQPFEVL